MIKINLLPTKKKPPKKVTDLQQQLIISCLILVVVVIGMGYYWVKQNERIATLESTKKANEKKIAEQDNLLKEVKNVEDERKKVADKIGIIEQLKKNQAGPVHLLDVVSTSLPKGVNIISLSENNGNIDVEGEAFTNEDVVRFVDNLKSSPLLTNVMLLETSDSKKEGIDFYKYKLKFVYKGL